MVGIREGCEVGDIVGFGSEGKLVGFPGKGEGMTVGCVVVGGEGTAEGRGEGLTVAIAEN